MVSKINLETQTSRHQRNFSYKKTNHAVEIETVIQPRVYSQNFSVNRIISWIKNTELRTKAIIFAVTIGVLPILSVGIATYSLVNKSVTKQITTNKQANALWVIDNIENYLKNREKEIQLLTNFNWISNTQTNRENTIAKKQSKINNWHRLHTAYESVTILDIQGNIVIQTHNANTTNNQARESYFPEILNKRKTIIGNLWTGNNIHESKIYLALPSIDTNTQKINYIIEAIIPLQDLEQIIQHPLILEDQYYLVDSTGKIFLSNNQNIWGDKIQEIFVNWQKQQKPHIFTRILHNKYNQREELITFIPWTNIKGLPDPQWQLILSTDKAIAFTTQEQLLLILAMGTIITAMLVGAAVIIIVNRLTLPIVTATMAVKKLSKGNFTTRINVKGENEIAALGASINRMADQLQDLHNNQLVEAERLELFTNILITIRQSLHSDDLLNQAVSESRVALEAHRVVIYHFNSRNRLQILAESVAPGVTIKSAKNIENIAIVQELVELCQQHGLIAINNILEPELAPEYLQLMQQLKTKATLVTPILKDNQIFGFLIADYCWAPHIWQHFEINFLSQLAVQVGLSLERVSLLEHTQALKELATHMSGSLNSQDIYNLAVEDIQKALQVEQVLICKLDQHLQPQIIHRNSFISPDSQIPNLATNVDIQFPDEWVENYVKNLPERNIEIQEIDGLQLASSIIDSNLVAPILLNNQLFGLLIAHDISRIRVWQQSEIDLLEQLARHIGIALERANVLENSLQILSQLEKSLEQQTDTNVELKLHLQQLHSAIAEIAKGNLTVRAQVSDGEIGTVAQLVNTIADHLQEIVTQVKLTDRQVNTAITENSGAISQLAIAALKQSEEITRTVDAVDTMRLSMKEVATNAQQAITITNLAACSTEDDQAAIKFTIDRFLDVGKTIVTAVEQLQGMEKSIGEISHMVSSLNQIATSTNLVAINTGIAVSRTGGTRGEEFTMFASEIATLTAKVATTTTEIHRIASNLQQQTTQAGKVLELESIKITEDSHLLSNNWLSLNRIADTYSQIDRLMQSISLATTSQLETSKEVTNAMKKIAKASKMASNSSRQFSTSVQKTIEISQQMQATISKLQGRGNRE